MPVSAKRVFEVNGERQVEGTLDFDWGVYPHPAPPPSRDASIKLACPTEFPEPLMLWLEWGQFFEVCDFFHSSETQSWKVVVLDGNTNIDTVVTIHFAREPELTLHLSIAAGMDSRHFVTSLSDMSSDLEAFFSEEKGDFP